MSDSFIELLKLSIIEESKEEAEIDENIKKAIAGTAIAVGTALGTGKSKIDRQVPNNINVKTNKADTLNTPDTKENLTHSEILMRQAFKESRFDPKAISSKGAKGIAQIMPSTLKDYEKSGGGRLENIDLHDAKNSIAIQVHTMKNLYNAGFINKKDTNQSEIVRLAKTLAAYNYGRGNLSNLLNRLVKEGKYDIYNSLEWIKELPNETKDYINKILLKKDDNFNTEYTQAKEDTKNSSIVALYNKISGLNK